MHISDNYFDQGASHGREAVSFDQGASHGRKAVTESDLQMAAAKWILKNREGHRIPHSVMESIVSGANSLYKVALSEVRSLVIDRLKESNTTSDVIDSVTDVFDNETQYTSIFRGLEITYRQNAFIKSNFRYVVSPVTQTVKLKSSSCGFF